MSIAALLLAALAGVAACSETSPGAVQTPSGPTSAAPTPTSVGSATSAASSSIAGLADAPLPALDDLPPLLPSDPAFAASEACRTVEAHYRHRSEFRIVEEGASIDDVSGVANTHVSLLAAVAGTELVDQVPDLDDAVAIERAYAERLLERWGTDGEELYAEASRSGTSVFRLLLDEPIVVDGRTVSQDATVAADLTEAVDDSLVLACTEPPDGWAPPTADPALQPPPIEFVAADDRANWFLVRLDDPAGGELVASGYGSLAPNGASDRLVGVTPPDRNLQFVDPLDWSAEPVPGAGTGWSCPSWTTDGTAIVGDLVDAETGERTAVRLDLEGDAEPTALAGVDESCPKSIGPDEVVVSGDDALVGVASDGSRRELMTLDRCNLVPITGARGGLLDVYANCANPYLDGLHQLDLASGEVTHLIAGLVGAGAVSLDGRWRLFGYVAHGESASDPVLWVLDQQSGRAAPLDGLRAYFPVFVAS